MTITKICGIRRFEDIQYVNKHLPQYIGFIFAESKRRVSVDQVKDLKQELDPSIKTVGVFVNENMEKIADIITECSLDCVQIHGDETSEDIDMLRSLTSGIEIWKAIRVKDESSISSLDSFKADAFVLDAFIEGSYGGAGKVFDWKLATLAKDYGKIILAGGLNPDNVSNAIESVKPYGVDVSSGVEKDGFKDESKIRHFINEVRRVDRE